MQDWKELRVLCGATGACSRKWTAVVCNHEVGLEFGDPEVVSLVTQNLSITLSGSAPNLTLSGSA
jgi:hypothetical protein